LSNKICLCVSLILCCESDNGSVSGGKEAAETVQKFIKILSALLLVYIYPYLDLAALRPFPEEMGDAIDQATSASLLGLFAIGPKIYSNNIMEKLK
jgi:hypothetical protein